MRKHGPLCLPVLFSFFVYFSNQDTTDGQSQELPKNEDNPSQFKGSEYHDASLVDMGDLDGFVMLFLFPDFFVKPANQNITDHQSQNPTKHGDNSALFKIAENHDTLPRFHCSGSILYSCFMRIPTVHRNKINRLRSSRTSYDFVKASLPYRVGLDCNRSVRDLFSSTQKFCTDRAMPVAR